MDTTADVLNKHATAIGATLLLIVLLIAYAKSIAGLSANPLNCDFGRFYESSRLYWQGKNIYTRFYYKFKITVQSGHKVGIPVNLKAPFFTVLILPLGLIDYQLALYIWSAISIAAGLVSARLLAAIIRQYHATPILKDYNLFAVMSVILFAYFPSFSNIIYGQTGLLLLLFLASAWKYVRDQKQHWAGIMLGVIFSIKVFVGLFLILFLLRRQWRLLGWMLGTFIVCNVIALSLFGLDSYLEYYKTLHLVQWFTASWNASLLGLVGRLFGTSEGNVSLWQLTWLTPILHKLCSLILLVGLWRLTKADTDNSYDSGHALKDFDIGFCYTLVAMLLISPLGWMYYFTSLIIVFSIIGMVYKAKHFSPYLFCLTVLAAFLSNLPRAMIVPKYIPDVSFSLTWASFYCYALLLLVFILFKISKSKPSLKQEYVITDSVIWLSLIIVLLPSFVSIIMYAINNPINNALDSMGVVGYSYQ